jgi:hypothetical protein
MKTLAAAVVLAVGFAAGLQAQNEPNLIPDVVDPAKLIPILPEAPSGWTAEKGEGSSDDVGGFKITNVHRDYRKGEAVDAPTAAISILDSVANPDYVEATTGAWKQPSETPDGYAKPVTIDGNPGFEAYEKDQNAASQPTGEKKSASPSPIPSPSERGHASLWVMVAKRYFVEIELQNQDQKELQEWIKRIDLKKLAEIKK